MKAKQGTSRPVITVYYFGKNVVRINRAKYPNNAVYLCVNHMQLNDYDASVAEVYDDKTLHAVIKNVRKGGLLTMQILYKREVK